MYVEIFFHSGPFTMHKFAKRVNIGQNSKILWALILLLVAGKKQR
jgi:hypothetical protein